MARLDPHSYADLEQGRTREIAWEIDVSFAEKVMEGRVTLFLEEAGGGPLDLDSRGLEILSVCDGAGADLPYEVSEPEGFMGSRLRLERSTPADVITIRYRTSPSATALQWLEGEQTSGGRLPFMFSQCQAIHARSIVPCQDTPAARFSYSAEVRVPGDLVAVMAAAPGAWADLGDGRRRYSFEMPQRIPSYLLALAVGNLVSRDLGPRTRVYAEPEVLDAASWEFEGAEDMLNAAEELFGPYHWDRFDFLVMPPAFPYGGMENPRLTFLTPTLLAGDRSMVNVLAHELAHSWTGNLVTNATMNDFWLNEGFTVWAERRILERLEGREFAALHAVLGLNGLRGALEQFGDDSVWTWLHTDMKGVDPDEVYSLVPYEKGFLFVRLLEDALGREEFDRFIKSYMDKFAFQSITTEMFIEFFEGKYPGVLEQVGAEGWLHGPGLPGNAPLARSERFEGVSRAVAGFLERGESPSVHAGGWHSEEWILFLQALPRPLTVEQCASLDGEFGFSKAGNSEILSHWLVIAIGSNYEPAYASAESFLKRVGRGKYLKPLFRALMGNPGTAALGRRIFEEAKVGYHPIVREGLAALVGAG